MFVVSFCGSACKPAIRGTWLKTWCRPETVVGRGACLGGGPDRESPRDLLKVVTGWCGAPSLLAANWYLCWWPTLVLTQGL